MWLAYDTPIRSYLWVKCQEDPGYISNASLVRLEVHIIIYSFSLNDLTQVNTGIGNQSYKEGWSVCLLAANHIWEIE